jgi:hypothetical protein
MPRPPAPTRRAERLRSLNHLARQAFGTALDAAARAPPGKRMIPLAGTMAPLLAPGFGRLQQGKSHWPQSFACIGESPSAAAALCPPALRRCPVLSPQLRIA